MKLTEIAARLDCILKGNGDVEITGVRGIDEAEAVHLTFVSNPKYAAKARTTKAGAVIVSLALLGASCAVASWEEVAELDRAARRAMCADLRGRRCRRLS